MEMRTFGRTGLQVSILGFGCGAVGGLMVRGTPADQERAVARALEAGVNYFDTAAMYGNGESEKNLGRVLAKLKPDVVVGTKVRIPSASFGRIAEAVAELLEASLKRMGREQVDIFHLHNAITASGGGELLSARIVLEEVAPAFERLRGEGKLRFPGITAVGDTQALHQVIDSRAFVSAQVSYNMLNPSAGEALPTGYPAQDYGRMFDHTQAAGVGVVGIRVLAGGALSGVAERHPIASPPPDPIGSANSSQRRHAACAAADAAGAAGACRQPRRGRGAVRDHAQGDGHDPGRHGNACRIRAGPVGGEQRPAVAGRAGQPGNVAARLCRRSALMA